MTPSKSTTTPAETPVREEELERLDYFRDLRDRHMLIEGLKIVWRMKAEVSDLGLSAGDLRRLFELMELTRAFEERVGELFRQGFIPGSAFFGRGNEGLAVGSTYALEAGDTLVPMHRDLGAHLTRGQDLKRLMAQYMGRANGINGGRDLHFGNRELGIFQLISHIGTMIPIACGAAWAAKYRNERAATLVMAGDGQTSTGDFHQGLNLAAVHRLPVVVIIQNNLWAYKTPARMQFACKTLALRAIGYGIPGYLVDGTDVLACYEICKEALGRARSGEGPVLIEAVNSRLCGHSIYDSYKDYVPEEELKAWDDRDPNLLFRKRLCKEGLADDVYLEEVRARNQRLIDDAVNYAKDSPLPEGPDLLNGVFAP